MEANPALTDRLLLGFRGRGVELVEIVRRHGRRDAAGAKIFGPYLRIVRMHEDVAPLAPPALMAPIWLFIRQCLTDSFDEVT